MYVTIPELKDMYGSASVDSLIANSDGIKAIESVSSEMDSVLSSCYQLPLVLDIISQKFLAGICADITYAKMHTQDAPDLVLKRSDDAFKKLLNISKGLMEIPTSTGVPYPRKIQGNIIPSTPQVGHATGRVFSDAMMDTMCMTNTLKDRW